MSIDRDRRAIDQRTDRSLGLKRLAKGAVARDIAGRGAGSRWTQGAGVVKALHPFCKLGGRHRTFIEVASGQEPADRPQVRHAAAAH